MFKNLFLILMLSIIIGCGESSMVGLILDDSNRSSKELAEGSAKCFTGLESNDIDNEYSLNFEKDCMDELLESDKEKSEE